MEKNGTFFLKNGKEQNAPNGKERGAQPWLQDLCSRNIHTAGNNSQNDGVVLVQLGVGIDVTITPWWWPCGVARSCGSQLRFTEL